MNMAMPQVQTKAGLKPGQAIILILGLVLFIKGTYDWLYTPNLLSFILLCPIGTMLLGVLLIVIGGYIYPALSVSGLGELSSFVSIIIIIILLIVASLFLSGIFAPCSIRGYLSFMEVT
jgi:hypothetical protein